jgi:DNA-directed RNA polymerase subunit M
MEFCPKCGTRMIQKDSTFEVLHCPKCKHTTKSNEPLKNIVKKVDFSDESITILDKKSQKLRTLPTVNIQCNRCEKNRAETWTIATGSEGVSNIIFYRCISCGYTWREVD